MLKKMGHVKEAHGLKGELLIHIPTGDASWADDLETCLLKDPKSETELKLTVESQKNHKSGLRIKFKEILDRTQAEKYRGWLFLMDEDLLISKPGETIFLSEILNFEVQQSTGHVWGQIIGFSYNGAQDLLQIKNAKGVFEAPFVEDFIVNIDFENQRVIMNLPDGLQE